MNNIQALIFDIDGVITDGKKYTDGLSQEMKSVAFKDLDAIKSFQNEGMIVGCISGEDTAFSRSISAHLDYSSLGKKNKKKVLEEFCRDYQIDSKEVCYIGDGKYDIEALMYAGLSVCPYDAIYEVREVADMILTVCGGEGCLAELYTRLHQRNRMNEKTSTVQTDVMEIIQRSMTAHNNMAEQMMLEEPLLHAVEIVCQRLVSVFQKNGRLFFCGNGSGDLLARHFAALLSEIFCEKKCYDSAGVLPASCYYMTLPAADNDCSLVFSRQLERKSRAGDVIFGITVKKNAASIFNAFKQAREKELLTVLITGKDPLYMSIRNYADFMIEIPSDDTMRVQEGQQMMIHMICEIINEKLTMGGLK